MYGTAIVDAAPSEASTVCITRVDHIGTQPTRHCYAHTVILGRHCDDFAYDVCLHDRQQGGRRRALPQLR